MIKLKNIVRDFRTKAGTVRAVDNVTLDIAAGEIFGIIGFSGAGKSTLVRCINLLERPSAGTVTVDGKQLTAMSQRELREARRNIGMIFQHFNLMPSRTVAENVAFPLDCLKLSDEEKNARVMELLKLVDISEKAKVYPSQLSGGQKQRVAIARALACQPKVLLCDEATSALDPQTTKSILKLLKSLSDTLGLTIVIITHEMSVVKEICSRVAVMENGRVVESGDVFSIFSNPIQPITRDFIRTTSNLHVIDDLIAEKSPFINIKEGELIVRLSYLEKNVVAPLISDISRRFNLDMNIIFADIDLVQNSTIGGTVAIVGGRREDISAAIKYLIEKNIGVEVVLDGRAS